MTVVDSTSPESARAAPRTVITPGVAKGRRRWGLMATGLTVVVVSALGIWYLVQSIDDRQLYVVSAGTIERWDQVSAADFTTVEANVGEAAAMTAAEANAVFGLWATGRIPAGSLVTAGMFSQPPLSSPDEAGRVVIEVPLPAGDVAYGTLETGDTVALIGRVGDAAVDGLAAAEEPNDLSLIGVLTLDFVQNGNAYYVVDPETALQILATVDRYESSSDRFIWKLGVDLSADDIAQALRNHAEWLAGVNAIGAGVSFGGG